MSIMKTQHRRLRVAAILVSFAVGLTLVSLGVMGSLSVQAAETESVKEADVVVQFNDHDVIIRPITFTGEISGFRALELTGLDIAYTEDLFVYNIEGIGCTEENPYCGGSNFWNYEYWDGSSWQGYMVGGADSVITQTGVVEGYRWGEFGDTPPPPQELQAAQGGLTWLQARQSITNGSYSGLVSPSLEVMLAAGANHIAADEWKKAPDASSLMDFVTFTEREYAEKGVAEAGKLGAAISAGDGCWPPGAPVPSDYYSDTINSLSDQAGFLSWGIIGSLAISDTAPTDSVAYLRGLAQPSGGWEWSPGWGEDTNSTAIAIQALVAGGVPVTATEIVSGLAYLKSAQNNDGGFPYAPNPQQDTDSDSNSTAWIVQALLAAGENPRGAAWTKDGDTPLDLLMSVKLNDGSFEFMKGKGSDEFATRQVIQALLGSTHPMRIQDIAVCDVKSTWLPLVSTTADGPQ